MLGKLLKYEFRSTGRMFGVIYLVILILSLVLGLLGRNYLTSTFTPAIHEGFREMLLAFLLVAYFVMIIAMIILTLVVILERFYRNLLKGEGYLMHTLPVPTWMLVAGKLIAAVIWNVLGVLVVVLSLVIIVFTGGIWREAMPEFSVMMHSMLSYFQTVDLRVVGMAVNVFVNVLSGILLLYTAMAIGGSAKRHKKTFSILTFIVLLIICMVIQVRLLNVHGGIFYGIDTLHPGVLLWDTVINGIYSAVFFALTTFFLQRRLNLE